MADVPSLSRADMERVIQDGGSVLLPAKPGQIGRVITRLEDLPPEDRLARQGLADPRVALADLERQEADLARRKADLLSSLPQPPAPVESVTTPEESGVESVTSEAEAPPEEGPLESVTTPEAADPLEAPPEEETGDRPAGRRRKGW